jgi:hypothetical protein
MNSIGFGEIGERPDSRLRAGTPPSAAGIGGPAAPLFPPTSFGERTFADFVAGGGGHLSAPVPRPAKKGTDPQPFFKSERTQGFNERTAQFKMETFSGTTRMGASKTGTYRNKSEAPARFVPSESAGRVRYYGTSGNETFDADAMRKRYVVSANMDKALPFQQVRVGPAVGKGVGVASADGFHPYLRVVPNNVGVYKKNNLPGRIVPGKSIVDSGTSRDFEFAKHHPKKFYEMQRRPLARSGDPTEGVRAAARIPEEPRTADFITRDQVHPGDLRCPRGVSALDPCGSGEAALNRTGAWAGGGQAGVGASTVGVGATRGSNGRTIDGGRPAPGGQAGVRGQTGPGMGVGGFAVDAGRFEKLARDGSKSFGDYLNNQASSSRAVAPAGVGADMYSTPQPTVREQTGTQPHNVGIVAVTGEDGVGAAPTVYDTFKQMDREAKRVLVKDGFTSSGHIQLPDETTFDEFTAPARRPAADTIGAVRVVQ